MSDNVSKFDPHPGKSIARRIVLFVLALVLVGGAVTLYVFRDSLNLDAAKRFVRYLNVKTDSAGGSFTFDSHNANQYADLQGGLAVASVSGLSLYDANGDELAVVQAKLDTPAIRTGGKLTLAFDVGGTNLLAVRQSGETALSLTTQRPIFDADMAADGSLCYATSESGYKTVLYVYDSNQNRIYRWLSASQFMPVCAVSAGGKYLASVSLGQRGWHLRIKPPHFPDCEGRFRYYGRAWRRPYLRSDISGREHHLRCGRVRREVARRQREPSGGLHVQRCISQGL